MKAIQQKDPEVVLNNEKVCEYDDRDWLNTIKKSSEWFTIKEKWLEWVNQQFPAIFSKCAESLIKASTSNHEMEQRSELEVRQIFKTLVKTDERLTHSMWSMPDSQECNHIDKHLQVFCHWKGEYNQFKEELRKWKKFL